MAFENNVQGTLQANVAIGATTVDVVKAVAPNKDVPASGRLTLSATGKTEIITYTARTNPTNSQTFAVTAVGGNFIISSVANKSLTLKVGSTYIFTYPSGHPFRFSTTADGTHGSGSEYTTGVTHNSATQTTVVVSDSTPAALYYYCSYHAGMGGSASVVSYWTLTGVAKNAESSFGDQAWTAGDTFFQALTAADVINLTTIHSATAPTNPTLGTKWFNTATGAIQEYLTDGTDSAWLDVSAGAVSGPSATGTSTYADVASLPVAGNTAGTMAYVTATTSLYVWVGYGWFAITITNASPTFTTSPNASYNLATDGTTTVITLAAVDPEGHAITWGHQVTSGTLGATTITNADNVFTITPSTVSGDAGDIVVAFTVTDGMNIATADSTFSLDFANYASGSFNAEILVVGGGGGGGRCDYTQRGGGGGGGGGFITNSALEFTAGTTYPIVVGTGGIPEESGTSSSLNNQEAIGGGGGGIHRGPSDGSIIVVPKAGGSGGGGSNEFSGGLGTSGQGNNGGAGGAGPEYPGAGGGGAGQVGGNYEANYSSFAGRAGNGGNGLSNGITGTSLTYSGGGGGVSYLAGGNGGAGGGGAGGGGGSGASIAISGTTNLGGGGGAGYFIAGGSGGSGIVIIRTVYEQVATTGSPVKTTDVVNGIDYFVYTFTQNGSITF